MRIKNAFRNSFFSVISQVILILVGFFSQRVMNLRMGEELVGMNSVISNINAILSISELGMSTAVVFHLYSAFANGDEKRIASLMKLYKRAYCVISAVIVALGLCVLPYVHLFLKENSFSISYIRFIYGLWLLRAALACLLSYKRSILIADQREYIISIAALLANVLNYLLIIVMVELFRNYAAALALNIVVEVLLNLWISQYVNQKYTFLRQYKNEPMDKDVVKKVFGDIKNIFVIRMSTNLLTSTDNLIMSSFISVAVVGLYSNYSMIIQSVTNILEACSNALQPTVGNLFTEQNHKKEYDVLRQITFLFFCGTSFASVSLIMLMTPFVADVWLGREYALSMSIIVCCVVNFFTRLTSMPLAMMMGVTGLFDKERNLSILVAVTNLGLSLALVSKLGVVGVLLGTFASYMIQIVVRIKILIRDYMHQKCGRFVFEMLQYVVITVLEVIAALEIKKYVYIEGSILSFILLMIICVLLPNLINYVLFHRNWRFLSILGLIKNLLASKETDRRRTKDKKEKQ